MASVKINLNNMAKGAIVEIPYLGKFKNGETTEVDDRKWNRFVRLQPGADQYADSGTLEVTSDAQKKATEEHAKLVKAVRSGNLDSLKKDELVTLASGTVSDADDMKKDELVDTLKSKTNQGTTAPREEG